MQLNTNAKRHSRNLLLSLTAFGLLLPAASCPGPDSRRTRRYKKSMLQKSLEKFESTGLVVGEFPLSTNGVIDGDTIRVDGLRTSLRLLAIDTEETFKKPSEKRLFSTGWKNYLKVLMGKRVKPVKMATPLGMEAKKWAEKFFDGVSTVRLERDHPKEIRGRFDRYLVYVFAKKNGQWVNYNLECVRAGMSPYFTKYSYSRRFHKEFLAAQAEARQKKLGIWDPEKMHYIDYDKRLAWWYARADFIKQFEADAIGKPNYIVLTNWDALRRLEANINKKVVILATVGQVKLGDRGPSKVMLSRRRGGDFALIFWDKDVFGTSRIAKHKGEYVRVSGRVSSWFNKRRRRDELQMSISLPGQIKGSDKVPDFADRHPVKSPNK